MRNEKVLVTGGSGYFGEVLIKHLLDCEYECGILDLNPPSDSVIKKIIFHQCDILDVDNVNKIVSKYDYVLHNVAQVPLANDKDLFRKVNNLGTQILLNACFNNRIKKVVYTSSSAVYGIPKFNPVNEDSLKIPVESYGEEKLNGEKLCDQYRQLGLNVCIVRPRTIVGAGRMGIFSILFDWISHDKKLPVFDNGNNIYQFIHANDLADAIIIIMEKGINHSYNIGADDYTTMAKTLNNLCLEVRSNSTIKSFPSFVIKPLMKISSFLKISPLGAYHIALYGKSLYFDTNLIKTELNWRPKYSTTDMFVESYNLYLQSRNQLNYNGKSHHKKPVNKLVLNIFEKIFL